MKKLTIISVLFSVLFISFSCNAFAQKKLQKKLIGVWQICNPDGNVANDVGGNEGVIRYKIITADAFTVSQINLKSRNLLNGFYGSYTLENNIYTEYIHDAQSGWQHLKDVENVFKIEIKKGKMHIKGVNNTYEETWEKVTR